MEDAEIVIALNDERAKYIGEVIGNETCKRILSSLNESEKTVTDIANKLNIQLNTVDYNVKKLVKSGLIEKASHWWSIKGKKMPSYRIANKKIVLFPKKLISYGKYLLAFAVTGFIALILKWTYNGNNLIDSSQKAIMDTGEGLMLATQKTGEGISAVSYEILGSSGFQWSAWMWFLIGAWICIFVFVIINFISERRFK